MNAYTVTWTIDCEADTPEDAAQQALEIQRDAMSEATFFDVTHLASNNTVGVEL